MKEQVISADGALTISLSETLSFEDHERFRDILDSIKSTQLNKCIFDLNRLESIDSAGLGMLMIAFETAEESNLDFSLYKPQGQVKKLLEISDFSQVMRIVS
ncbi:STAS domain-containing protein [Sneathiella glossodoripedis]|uniref:STAS domain-containing protein n=1 Tax=Sneathiella glossodoripedis TaxID=418853 RepID=UPI00131EE37D|nr:STAS domain-containing protein [Sneathiella glossodoripedis]